jgi:hypothetical protein
MKKQKQQAAPEFTTDADGQQLVHAALANTDRRATLYAEDYERILAMGFSPCWSITSTGGRFEYVLVAARSTANGKRSLTVARLVAEAGKGQRVGYLDGDRLNLRRDNLTINQGPAKSAAEWLLPRVPTASTPAAGEPERLQTSTPPSTPRAPFAPRVVDTKALGQRVRQQMTQQAREVAL